MTQTHRAQGNRTAETRFAGSTPVPGRRRPLGLAIVLAVVLGTACSGSAAPTPPTSAPAAVASPVSGGAAAASASPSAAVLASPGASPSASASPVASPVSQAAAQQALQALIAQANQEGDLEAEVVDTAVPAGDAIKQNFLQHFQPMGLNITVNLGAGQQPTIWGQAEAAIGTGTAPQYDAMLGQDDTETYPFSLNGDLVQVPNWQTLLAAVNPGVGDGSISPNDESPTIFAGYGFKFDDRLKVLLYNPQNTSLSDLPKTYQDWADPKYAGKYDLPPFPEVFDQGAFVYGQQPWLQIMQTLGKNSASVQQYATGAQQILSGQIQFQSDNLAEYFTQVQLSPNAPIQYAFFQDFTAQNSQFYSIPKTAKHPAAATLWALWETTDAARTSWAPAYASVNVTTGKTDTDNQVRSLLQSSGSRLTNFFSNTDGQQLLEFLTTPPGQQYITQIQNAITQRS